MLNSLPLFLTWIKFFFVTLILGSVYMCRSLCHRIYIFVVVFFCNCWYITEYTNLSFNSSFFQNMTLNYDTSGVGQNGVAATHMLPAATLTQYSRHYGQALPGYSVPGTPWVAPYLVHPSPPHMQQVDVSFYTLFVHFVFVILHNRRKIFLCRTFRFKRLAQFFSCM